MSEISLNGINFNCHHSLYQAQKGEKIATVYSILGKTFSVEIGHIKMGFISHEIFTDKDKAFKFAADCLNKNN